MQNAWIATALRAALSTAAAVAMVTAVGAPSAHADPLASHPRLDLGVHRGVPCPHIPDARDLELSVDERLRIDDGQIVVQIVHYGDDDRQVRAVGYLDADPVSLFDLATDSERATELVSAVKKVEVIEQREDGKLFRGTAKPSFFLPTFNYTLAAHYPPDHTGQCWGQVEGDFERNEGAHSFIWDPERRQTLAVFSYYLSLRGVLRLVPESWILATAGKTLPEFMHRLEAETARTARSDPARASRNAQRWSALRARLDAGELPGRVWRDIALAERSAEAVSPVLRAAEPRQASR
jgi:hypothetical protein